MGEALAEIRGTYVHDDGLTPGRREGGGLSQSLYDEHGRMATHAVFIPDEESDEDESDFSGSSGGVGLALAGLALVGLTLAAVGTANAVRRSRADRREGERTQVEASAASNATPSAQTAPPGWYDIGSGRQRWWDGQRWTEHYQSDPRHRPAPAGWYDDGSGRERWWDGFAWTDHYRQPPHLSTSSRPEARPHRLPAVEVERASQAPEVSMTRAEWQERVRAMLLARAISEQQWRILSTARIEDADHELVEWQRQLAAFTPQEFADQINRALAADPALDSESRRLAQAGWYDDGSGRHRWWDGQQWTNDLLGEPVGVRRQAIGDRDRWSS